MMTNLNCQKIPELYPQLYFVKRFGNQKESLRKPEQRRNTFAKASAFEGRLPDYEEPGDLPVITFSTRLSGNKGRLKGKREAYLCSS
jgi:hypothetical protein